VDPSDDRSYARAPEVDDLVRIRRSLNEAGARYVLIGGFAVIAHGGARTTRDIECCLTMPSTKLRTRTFADMRWSAWPTRFSRP
jgi:hypothetical protein